MPSLTDKQRKVAKAFPRFSSGEVPSLTDEQRLAIDTESDIITARQFGREMASRLGFSTGDLTLIATAISEVARNIVDHAGRGEVRLWACENGRQVGICIEAHDRGPGIDDLELAMQDGYSSKDGLGLGLPGSRRIMDEFEIHSELGQGTYVLMKKWKL